MTDHDRKLRAKALEDAADALHTQVGDEYAIHGVLPRRADQGR